MSMAGKLCFTRAPLTAQITRIVQRRSLLGLAQIVILTSGGAVNVWDGRKQLKHLQNQYGKDITILAGSGVNDTNVRALIEYTGITQVHSSCGSWKCDVTAAGNAVDFSYDEAMKNLLSVCGCR